MSIIKKAAFCTLGCKVNQYETEAISELFVNNGYNIVPFDEKADVYLINTCSVTNIGDRKSRQMIRRAKKTNPESIIIVTGCYAQTASDEVLEIEGVNLVIGTKDRANIVEIANTLTPHSRINLVGDIMHNHKFEELKVTKYTDRTRAFIKIQEGCNQFCSYCIIPFARGRCRSKPLEVLRDELKMLADAGHREIVLVGINLAFYGMEYGLRLADAVEECCRISGIERVRLGSLEPEVISDDDLLRLSRCPQFCPQFHLSLQSGSDSVLRRMNRRYTTAEYYDLVCRIRKIFPDASFTTDIMTGFPKETEEEFVQSLEFAEKVGFAKIHVFQYSPRKGTVAEKMPQLSKKIKAERADRLKALGSQLQEKYLRNLVGKTVPVLFERENSTEFHHGYAPDYTLIKISRKNSKKSLRNFIFYVTIEEAHNDYCYGTICEP